MPKGLIRLHHSGQSHFVTFSCYHRLPKLSSPEECRVFLETLESTRKRFAICIYGYVLMPEHVHLLLSEPDSGTLAEAIHHLKLSSARKIHAQVSPSERGRAFWQPRYYDRNIRNHREFGVKLRYLHRNPVKRGLCDSHEQWSWSSFRHYLTGESCVVEIESEWTARKRETGEVSSSQVSSAAFREPVAPVDTCF
jgi:putative transposase